VIGGGQVPRVHARLPAVTFAKLEEPAGPLPADAVEVLERYYTVKLSSMQFCGPTNFGLGFWDGLETLLLTFPVICWLSRAFTDVSRAAAVTEAVRIVDNPFGFNRLLATGRQGIGLRVLARGGELDRLIAWYAR
jgi:lysine-N-methylase